jgi:hypothetical protein
MPNANSSSLRHLLQSGVEFLSARTHYSFPAIHYELLSSRNVIDCPSTLNREYMCKRLIDARVTLKNVIPPAI